MLVILSKHNYLLTCTCYGKPLICPTLPLFAPSQITCVVILCKHNYLLTGANDGSVKVWNLSTMMEVSVLSHDETQR